MFKSGIRNRLIASFLFLIVLTLLALGSYILWYFHKYNIDRLSFNLLAEAEVTEQLLRPYMNGPMEKAALDNVIKELATKVSLRITVIDSAGVVLADSWENPALMENHINRPEIAAALAGKTGNVTRYSTTLGENLMYVAIPMWNAGEITGVLRVSTTLAHVEAAFNEIRNVLLFSFLLTSLLAIMLSMRLARKYTAPIEEITEAAKEISDGNLDKRIHLRTGDELEILGHTLNHLVSNLDDKVNEITAEKRKLELVFENMDNAVLLFDQYGRVTDANKQAKKVFNIIPSMYGQHHVQVLGTSLLDKTLKDTIEQNENQRMDLKLPIHGVKRVFQVFMAPTNNLTYGSPGVLTVFHDITALKEVEERQADFVANASHELGTPLTSIKGFAESLLDGALRDEKLCTKFVTIIYEEAERMHRLVKDLLQLARISSFEYRQHVKHEPTSIQAVSRTVVQKLSNQLQAKRISTQLEFAPDDLKVIANVDWLNQIIVNLVENSIKFTPEGGKISIRGIQEEDKVLLLIEDTGIGIPPQDLPFVFDRFYRVDRARVKATGGTGLGLAIVKFMVETLGGKIEVKSKVDIGTTFTVTLPSA